KSALAALRISFARLNSATSLRSCFSSSRSTLVSRSSRSPLSASAWRTQPRRASLWMPRSFATCAIGRPVVRTSRTARSRSSSGYLRGAGTARGSPSGQDHKPGFRDSTKPGAAHWCFGPGPSGGEPEGVGASLDDRAVEGQAVHDGRAEPGVSERLRPAAEGLVGGDGDAVLLLALGQHLE